MSSKFLGMALCHPKPFAQLRMRVGCLLEYGKLMFNMAYSDKFVLSVLLDGNVQKEQSNGIVPLPFDRDFGVRLRNKNERRVCAQLFIDGENVSGNGWIVPAKEKIDILRPVNKDTAFRFVSLESVDAADFGKADNRDGMKGVIEARFFLEKIALPESLWWTPVVGHHTQDMVYTSAPTWSCGSEAFGTATASFISSNLKKPMIPNHPTVPGVPTTALRASLTTGCMVEGKQTGQKFSTTSFTPESSYVSLRLTLKGFDPDKEVLSRFCVQCGNSRIEKANFCGNCGTKFS